MRLNRIFKTVATLMLSIMLVSCSGLRNSGRGTEEDGIVNKSNEDTVTLELWSHYDIAKPIIDAFENENPNIKVNVKVFDYEQYELEYKKSLVEDVGSADLMVIDSNHYGSFNSIKGLENLLEPQYTAMDYKDDFDKELWELGKSMDKKELLGLPIASAPIVTYYREDIMKKYGFPSEPQELAEFMKDRDNWMKIGETLAEDGIYTVQWAGEIIRISTSNMPYFNEKLEYQRDNNEFKESIAIAREARLKGLSPFADIWSEQGMKLLKDDKFAMLYLGSWGGRELELMVPEQAGKWRMTSLPFGKYGWNNASILSIPENSKHKDAAWKFMEFYTFKYNDKERLGSVSAYLPFRGNEHVYNMKNEYLGGQQEQKFYEDIMSLTEEYPVTALDDEAFKLWDRVVNVGIDEDHTNEQIMENIKSEINSTFKKEKEILLNRMNSK